MSIVIVCLLFFAAGLILGFGDGGSGSLSPYISVLGGLLWLGTIVYAFLSVDIKFGLISILISFFIAAVAMPIGKIIVALIK